MSLLPQLEVFLNEKMTDEKCQKVRNKIAGVKGVVSVRFNKVAKVAKVTYSTLYPSVVHDICMLSGVRSINHIRRV